MGSARNNAEKRDKKERMSEGEERRDALIGEEEQKDRMKERAKRCTNRGRRA